jgi:hypothetical protein
MIKRNFYLTLMWLWNIMFFSTTFYLSSLHIGFFFLSLIIQFLLVLIFFVINLIIDDNTELDTYCPFMIGFFTLFRKKIYYSDLGYFWIRQKGNEIIVSKQDWFFTKSLFSIYIGGNIESIKNEIKSELQEIYKKELEEKKKKEIIQKWDGYLDIASKRDDIINKIIK